MPAVAAPPSHREACHYKEESCDDKVDDAEARELRLKIISETVQDAVGIGKATYYRQHGHGGENNQPMKPPAETHAVDDIIKQHSPTP